MSKLRALVLHLDLGIGGAEKLMVNLCLALQSQQQGKGSSSTESSPSKSAITSSNVLLLTTHHDPSHCFEETKPNGELGPSIRVHGDFLPRSILGRFTALCAIVRMLYLALVALCYVYLGRQRFDFILIDGVSACVPILRLSLLPVLFYCHYPDQYLCVERGSMLKRFYRAVVDKVEELTTFCSSKIIVNSEFTSAAFQRAFDTLGKRYKPEVLYPTIDEASNSADGLKGDLPYIEGFDSVFLSLNRYERKKNIELSIHALQVLSEQSSTKKSSRVLLVVAGGYDERVQENREYLQELRAICDKANITHRFVSIDAKFAHLVSEKVYPDKDKNHIHVEVVFRASISNEERKLLLLRSKALLYTPHNEHFGIVPIEAMYLSCPVIAVRSGGPLETVQHDLTGFLCDEPLPSTSQGSNNTQSSPSQGKGFAQAMTRLHLEKGLREKIGEQGRSHVLANFTNTVMQMKLLNMIRAMCRGSETTPSSLLLEQYAVFLFAMLAAFGSLIRVVASLPSMESLQALQHPSNIAKSS